jgi:hypothetical protein
MRKLLPSANYLCKACVFGRFDLAALLVCSHSENVAIFVWFLFVQLHLPLKGGWTSAGITICLPFCCDKMRSGLPFSANSVCYE